MLKDQTVLFLLLESRKGVERYEALYNLSYLVYRNAEYISSRSSSAFSGKEDILPIYTDVQRYMYDWRRFYFIGFMYEDWADLREEGISLLRKLIEEDSLNGFKKDVEYKEFLKKFPVRYGELLKRDYEEINQILKEESSKRAELKDSLKEFIEILGDPDKEKSFFRQYGRDVFQKVDILIALVMEEAWSENKRRKLVGLEVILRDGVWKNDTRERRFFGIRPIYDCFQEYMNDGNRFFANRQVPIKEWRDLAKEEFDLLKVLIEENKLDQYRGDPRYIHWYYMRHGPRIDELIKKGYSELNLTNIDLGL